MSRFRILYIPTLLMVITGASLLACSEDKGPTEPTLALNNCTSCHLDADTLEATAESEEEPGNENPGEG